VRAEVGEKDIVVVLSRRNLLALLAKLDGQPADSACTVFRQLAKTQEPELRSLFHAGEHGLLWVKAEEDDVHYVHPEREGAPPGRMHPDTEGAL
jgi:hypothetical protein